MAVSWSHFFDPLAHDYSLKKDKSLRYISDKFSEKFFISTAIATKKNLMIYHWIVVFVEFSTRGKDGDI